MIRMVKFGIEFVPNRPFREISFHTESAEAAGFDYAWYTDHYPNRNVYVTLSIIATRTRRITLGTGVVNPYLVNPVVTAQAIASLEEIAPGRIVLGIGAGDRATFDRLGIGWVRPLSAVRECVEIFRSLFAGKKASMEGRVFNIKEAKFDFPVEERVPIYVGAQGPRMLELAGEIGDGVLVNASHPDDIKYAVDRISEGVRKAKRDIEDVDIVAYTAFSVDKDPGKAARAAIPVVAFITAGTPPAVLARHGIESARALQIREALAAGKWDRIFGLVSSDLLDVFSVSGTPDTCIERIRELTDIGVTQFVVGSPIGPNVQKSIGLISKKIFPRFTGA